MSGGHSSWTVLLLGSLQIHLLGTWAQSVTGVAVAGSEIAHMTIWDDIQYSLQKLLDAGAL